MVAARPPPAGRRVAVLDATPAPETTVAMPPRTARAPSDAPAPAALPPMLAPAPTADPIVRTTASAGLLTTAGVFSCQTRTPNPATTPSNPATTHSSISTPPPLYTTSGRIGPPHAAKVASHLSFATPASPRSEETAPARRHRAVPPARLSWESGTRTAIPSSSTTCPTTSAEQDVDAFLGLVEDKSAATDGIVFVTKDANA